MRGMKLVLLPAFALAAVAAPAAAQEPRQAEANAAFVEYPKESLKALEQGIVHYRVKIDSRGRPKQCEITQSSGHQRLDMATCNLLLDKARFSPGRNEKGRFVRSTYEGRVHWRIS